MNLYKFVVAASVMILMLLPLSLVQAGGDDNPMTVTSVPREMSYQGILRDSGGNPVEDSVYSITFRIFNVSSGGSSLWDETLPCTTTAGVFTAMFSYVSLPFDEDYWLELEIDTEILDPRQKMGMVGYSAVSDTADYAQRVATVDGATGGTISGNVSIQSDLAVAGDISATGKATIGPGHTNTGIYAFVAGENNTANGYASAVSGAENYADGENSTIGGGYSNSVYGHYSGVFSGWSNSAGNVHEDTAAFVGGGFENSAAEGYSTVGGGQNNIAGGHSSTVGGGGWNRAHGIFSVVSGGGGYNSPDSNAAIGDYSVIGGGRANVASANYNTICGGYNNAVQSEYGTVCGGQNNTVINEGWSAICGGWNNTVQRRYSFIGGGSNNHTHWEWSVIGGGLSNYTGGARCVVAGGQDNEASGSIGWAAVGGGSNNTASGNYSFVGGGSANTASGDYSAVPGGANNNAQGNYSFAAGKRAKANHSGSFVWGDDTDADFASTGDDQFLIRASGGVGIGIDNPTSALHVNGEAKCEVGGVEFFMVPRGAIIMWSGLLADIPSGWALCDGSNNTPNLSDRFIYSVHTGENPGTTGGSATIPGHNHTVDIGSFSSGSSSWNWYGASGGVSQIPDYRHNHSINPPATATTTNGSASNIPPYYKLAFIMKL